MKAFEFKDSLNKKNDLFNYEEIDQEAQDEDIEFEKKRNINEYWD